MNIDISVPFFELKRSFQELRNEISQSIVEVLESGQYILGEALEKFETQFANYCNSQYAIGVGNGLDALYLSLKAIGVETGDEVIVPANTYIATWLAVSQCGAKVVPIEPDERTYCIDPHKIEQKISPKTKAIIPVHLYGQPADLELIYAVAEKYGLWVLEDAAQAHGALYKGKRIGFSGGIVAWSFYPTKNLGAFGDGGAITVNNPELAEKLIYLRNYGSKQKYYHEYKGINSRLDPIQAAILSVKLRYLDEWNERRCKIARRYHNELQDIDDLILPHIPEYATPCWHLFVIRTSQRDHLQEYLRAKGIGTMIHYPIPPHLSNAYRDMGFLRGDFPITEQLSSQILSLPLYPQLTDEEVDWVVESIKSFYEQKQ